MKINRFEDIEAWQKARSLFRATFDMTSKGAFRRAFAIRDQIQRAALSIMSNIAEGFGRRTDREFCQFLVVSHGSVAEFQSLLYAALDARLLNEGEFRLLYEDADQIGKMVYALGRYLSAGG